MPKKKVEIKDTVSLQGEELQPGEIKVVARVKMLLNQGRLSVMPGEVVILGDNDRKQGVNIENLLKNQSVVPYISEEQVAEIKKWWEDMKFSREHMRYGR